MNQHLISTPGMRKGADSIACWGQAWPGQDRTSTISVRIRSRSGDRALFLMHSGAKLGKATTEHRRAPAGSGIDPRAPAGSSFKNNCRSRRFHRTRRSKVGHWQRATACDAKPDTLTLPALKHGLLCNTTCSEALSVSESEQLSLDHSAVS